MAGKYLVLLLLQTCSFVIALSLSRTSVTHFRCINNVPRTPDVKKIIQGILPLKPRLPTAIGVSAVECAALCARTQFNACQSYSYNSINATCYTRNNTLERDGILCGIKADEARNRCKNIGDTLIAFGGENKTMMECVCGGDSTGWSSTTGYGIYNCIHSCKGAYPCAIDMYGGNCDMCNKTISTCIGAVILNNGTRLVCVAIP